MPEFPLQLTLLCFGSGPADTLQKTDQKMKAKDDCSIGLAEHEIQLIQRFWQRSAQMHRPSSWFSYGCNSSFSCQIQELENFYFSQDDFIGSDL
jgi:hypothetical protein